MVKRIPILLPSVEKYLARLGGNIKLARLRRRFSGQVIAERAAISRATVHSIEQGSPRVSLGAYASVLACLGLEGDLSLVARDDELGRKLQDASLVVKKRAPKRTRRRRG